MTDRARELVAELQAIRNGVDAFNPDARLAAHSAFDAAERVWKMVPEIIASLTPPEGDTVSEGVVELVRDYVYDCTADEFGHGWTLSAEQTAHVIRLAALQSRVSPQAGTREALEAARKALAHILGGALSLPRFATSEAQDAIAQIESALSTAPIPMSEDAK